MSRLLAISDIHGHHQGLQNLLEFSGYNPDKDKLFLLGDYLSKSETESTEMLRLIQELVQQGARAIIGNHEARLISRSDLEQWQKAWIPFINTMSYYIDVKDYLFVHAGIRPGIPIELQTAADLTQIRDEFLADTFVPEKHVVFGHTPTNRLGCSQGEIYGGNCKIGIDTGAKHNLRLTLVDLTNRLAYSCSTSIDCMYSDLKMSFWDR